jgi:N-acetyl-anhydromuramyl-L-alanine amidase AmpD
MLDPSKLPFIQANRFQSANRHQIDLIVIHTMEADQTEGRALACAKDFATTSDPRSAHYCIDNAAIIHTVQEKDVAFAAPGSNQQGIHLEHAGFARMTAADWAIDYSTAMLGLSAQLSASIAFRRDVPIVWLSPEDLVAGKRGITSHNNVSLAFHLTTHTDPGPNFPVESYLKLVQQALADGSPPGP